MIAHRVPREIVLEHARAGYRERYPEGRPAGAPAANVGPALRVLEADAIRIPYKGREYELGHVSFEDGLRLVEAKAAIVGIEPDADPTPERVAAYLQAMRLVVSIAPRYLVPVTPVRRLLWRLGLRRNPFRSATDAEVGHFLGFFLACRTRSRVRYSAPVHPGARVPTS